MNGGEEFRRMLKHEPVREPSCQGVINIREGSRRIEQPFGDSMDFSMRS